MNISRELPKNFVTNRRTPTFTSQNVPKAFMSEHDMKSGSIRTVPEQLLNVHDLKSGTWGLLNVVEGKVNYFLAGEKSPIARLSTGDKWVVLPEEKHFIEVSDDVVFFIEFYRHPDK